MKYAITEESFLKDVQDHVMKVVRDDGVFRHLRFAEPGTYNMHFDIVTYTGYLCYTGDMGCFVFSRVEDMFTFFRGKTDGPLKINCSYWHEKLQAVDRCDGSKRYDEETAIERVKEWLDDNQDRDDIDGLREEVDQSILSNTENEYEFREALRDFDHNGKNPFADAWEWSFNKYTERFVWCLYALVWGIRQYDLRNAAKISYEAPLQVT